MDKLHSFKGATALVTGASSGIGLGFARKLAFYGINLVLVARSENKLNKLANELKVQYKINVDIIVVDLIEENATKVIWEYVQSHHISVEILVNNAGFGKWAKFLDEPWDSYQNMLALNINAVVKLTSLFLPKMLVQKNGIIINVASTAAFQPLPYIAVYGATKSFVLHFTEALAGEYLSENVQFLALCPGNTSTNFAQVANADTKDMAVSTVDEVVDAALYALKRNKIYCVPGNSNYALAQLSRFLPRLSMIKLVGNMLRKRVVHD